MHDHRPIKQVRNRKGEWTEPFWSAWWRPILLGIVWSTVFILFGLGYFAR